MCADRIDAQPARTIVNKMILAVLDRPANGMVPAMYLIEEDFKIPFWRLDHLRRRAVTVDVGFLKYIRQVYVRLCITQAVKLVKEVIHEVYELDGDIDDIDETFVLDELLKVERILEKMDRDAGKRRSKEKTVKADPEDAL